MKRKIMWASLLVIVLLAVGGIPWVSSQVQYVGATDIETKQVELEVAALSAEMDLLSQLDSIIILTSDIAQLHHLKTRLEQEGGILLLDTADGFQVKLDIPASKKDEIDLKIKELIQQLKKQVSELK